MGMKEYVLWGGGLLVVLVVAHGLWQAWRSRRRRSVAGSEVEPDVASGDGAQMDIFEPPVLGDVDDADAPATVEPTASADSGALAQGSAVAADAATDEDDSDGGQRGRRVVIPGKRTEPTVPRNDHLFKVRKPPPETSRAPSAPPGLDQVVVIWVAAKEGTSFGGQELVKALADNGLRYGNDALFRKFDVDSGEELFSVVNGLEPGTFDLSDLDALSTPRIVMLLSLVSATTGLAAFSEMLDAAQDISISLGGELRDEDMGPMTGQTIEHYRQRISDYKRKSLRK